jgi:hypothetical protein
MAEVVVASFSPLRPQFNPMSVQLGLMVDKVVLGQVFLFVL